MDDRERCEREIAEIEALLRSGHSDIRGLCLALADWSTERKILQAESADDSRSDVLNEVHEHGKENCNGR